MLRDRLGRLLRDQSSGAGVLRLGQAVSADDGEHALDCAKLRAELVFPGEARDGSSRTGLGDEPGRAHEFSAALYNDAEIFRRTGNGRAHGDAFEDFSRGLTPGRDLLA